MANKQKDVTHQIDIVSIDVQDVQSSNHALDALTSFTGHETNEYTAWVCPPELYEGDTKISRCYKLYSSHRLGKRPYAIVIKPETLKKRGDRSGL